MGKKYPEHGHGQLLSRCKRACCGCLKLSQPTGGFCRTPTPCLPLAHTAPPTHSQGEGGPLSLLAQTSSQQVCPKGVFSQHWSSAMTPTFHPMVLFSILHPSPIDFDSPEEGGDGCEKFSFSERGSEDTHTERLMSSIQSCRQSSWQLLGC